MFIHLAEKNFAISHFSCAPYRGMALDVMKPTSFKITGKFVAVIFGFVYLFFFSFLMSHIKISSDAVKFLLHPDWYYPLHQYPLLP